MSRDLCRAAPYRRLRRTGEVLARTGLLAAAGTLGYRTARALDGEPGTLGRVVGDLRRIPDRLRRYGVLLGEITAAVTGVYRGLTGLPDAPPPDAVRLIWLSDVHNNPVAFAVARALAEQHPGALVVDTGDIGDWGRRIEARMFAAIADIPAPYLFIKGNHDGPQTLAELAKLPNVVILDGGATYRHAGVLIAGDADPRFTPDKSTGDDRFGAPRLAEAGRELAAALVEVAPDLVLVHDPVVATQLAGTAPLVLSGHTHRRDARYVDGTLLLTQGSSGGSGLRGVRQDQPQQLALSVLHLDPATRRLHSIDELTLGGLGATEVTLVRRSAQELGRSAARPEKA